MEDKKSIVVDFVKSNGPVLPVQISKHINMNILFAGAILSELAHNKRILITTVKKGGSPFYYIKGQEDKLQQLSQYISGKEKEAYELLKEKKVLKDRALEPAIRVALRAIKDFAFPLNVTANNNTEIFWKWYLIGDEQVSNQIKQMLGVKEEKKVMEKRQKKKYLKRRLLCP